MINGKLEFFSPRCIRICIDETNDKVLNGTLYGVALEQSIRFNSIPKMVIRIDDAYNIIGQPQPNKVLRSFEHTTNYNRYINSPTLYYTTEDIRKKKGKHKTVDIFMVTRTHAEWQGVVFDEEGDKIGSFQSIMECLNILEKEKIIE